MKLEKFYNGKVVLITGGSSGIGKELARQCLIMGAHVIITGRNQERLDLAKRDLGGLGDLTAVVCDVTNYQLNLDLIHKIRLAYEGLDVLITNAGLSAYGDAMYSHPKVLKEVIDVNIYGSLFPAMAAFADLLPMGGSVLFVSSIAGFQGLPGYSAYSMSKMALTALAQSMNAELKKTRLFVGIAYVGFTENEKSKRTLSPEGVKMEVPPRPELFTSTREETARRILKQIKNRKFSDTHSVLGKLTRLSTRLFPELVRRIMKMNYKAK